MNYPRCRRCDSSLLYYDQYGDLCCVACGQQEHDEATIQRDRLYDAIADQARTDDARAVGQRVIYERKYKVRARPNRVREKNHADDPQ